MTGPQQEQTCRTRTVTCETCNVQFEATLYDMGEKGFCSAAHAANANGS
jgi:hypothetical protein